MFSFGSGFDFGSHGHHSSREAKEVDNDEFYDILKVDKNASIPEIKKSFRKLAKKHHPDKGGDEEKFKEMQLAYEVLSDPEKKQTYDEHGKEGLGENTGSSGGMRDIFDLFSSGGSSRRQRQKGDNVNFPLKVTLEDLFMGMSKKLRLTKNVLCSACNAHGSKSGQPTTCRACKGSGVRMVVRQLGPGMIQQMQTTCSDCGGEGNTISDADRCPKCLGSKVVKERKTLEVFIEKGMKHGQKIPFKGEADQAPNADPGDVIVVLQAKDHRTFGREGMNLFIQKKITLLQALCGFSFTITHLDGRIMNVSTISNSEIIKPGEVKCIENEGMPQERNPFVRGGLFIEFEVEFPNKLSEIKKKKLQNILSDSFANTIETTPIDGQYDEVQLSNVSLEEIRERQRAYKAQEVYDEDEESAHEHRGATCRQQ